MTLEERSGLILAFATTLFVNGQSTDRILIASQRLASALHLEIQLIPRWGELLLQASDSQRSCTSVAIAQPSGVDMHRVASAMRLIQQLHDGHIDAAQAGAALSKIAHAPPAPTWLFAVAAGAGALALALLFGLQHWQAGLLIFFSAFAGGLLRRLLARHSQNIFLQPLCAALLAGCIGAIATRYELSSSLRLVAVCPCMVLVPGPHVLNSALDLIEGRLHLGITRLVYALLAILAISTGLLLGLSLFGVSLPIAPTGQALPLWLDIVAAGVAVACYSVFFSTPLRMLSWPVAVGMLAHALRWLALSLGASITVGALIACVTVGLLLTPVARLRHLPFAAIGFASVVSMMPGVFLFRMISGVLELLHAGAQAAPALLIASIGDGLTAITVIFAMSLGLILPKMLIDSLAQKTGGKAEQGGQHARG